MKDIKIDVDFKDTCIDFGKYVQERISSSTVKWNIPSLWEAYQDNMNKEVRDLLTDDKMTAEEYANQRVIEELEKIKGLVSLMQKQKIELKN